VSIIFRLRLPRKKNFEVFSLVSFLFFPRPIVALLAFESSLCRTTSFNDGKIKALFDFQSTMCVCFWSSVSSTAKLGKFRRTYPILSADHSKTCPLHAPIATFFVIVSKTITD